ncbi:MAG: hypothetical protein LBU73_01650 [Helicobacteraceae bacterium]|nr:hypothetical protein [Helicobacteraceae bacterium]
MAVRRKSAWDNHCCYIFIVKILINLFKAILAPFSPSYILKRIADWREKVSAGALLVTFFQFSFYGFAVAAFCAAISVYLTIKIEKNRVNPRR